MPLQAAQIKVGAIPAKTPSQEHSGVGKEIPEALPGQQVAGDRQQNRPDDGGIGNADHGHDSEGNAVIQAVQGRVVLVLRGWGIRVTPRYLRHRYRQGIKKGMDSSSVRLPPVMV